MKWVLADTAFEDLRDIWRYSYQEWGEAQADYYLDLLCATFDWLMVNPGLWRKRGNLGNGILSISAEQHEIFFTASNETLSVLRVLHKSRDFPQHFES